MYILLLIPTYRIGCYISSIHIIVLQGEPGAVALKGPTNLDNAVADFKKKFQDKTKNKWEERDQFKAHPGKYTLLEMGEEDDEEDSEATTVWNYQKYSYSIFYSSSLRS